MHYILRLLLLFSVSLLTGAVPAKNATVWIGMSSPRNGEREGIYRTTLDVETGELAPPALAAEIKAPGFLTVSPDSKKLYSTCQLADGKPGVAAFEIGNDGATLSPLNTQPTGDGEACFATTDRSGKSLFTAQYGNGSVAGFPIDADGRIQGRSALVKHAGSGVDKSRQDGPHPHSTNVDPTNRFVMVPDLGIDQVVIYEFDPATAKLTRHGFGKSPSGAGPRHMKFHPNGRFAFVVNELDLSVTAFAYDSQKATLHEVQTISTLPKAMREVTCTCSEIRVHPNGRFLYAANRGHDSIAAFSVEPETGKMTFIERESIRGSHPRNFNIDPTGKWLLVAGRDSNTVSVFRIDESSGGLIYAERAINSPSPICIEFQGEGLGAGG